MSRVDRLRNALKRFGQLSRLEAKAHGIPANLYALHAYALRPKVGAAAKSRAWR
jgi:hypothetical protein